MAACVCTDNGGYDGWRDGWLAGRLAAAVTAPARLPQSCLLESLAAPRDPLLYKAFVAAEARPPCDVHGYIWSAGSPYVQAAWRIRDVASEGVRLGMALRVFLWKLGQGRAKQAAIGFGVPARA